MFFVPFLHIVNENYGHSRYLLTAPGPATRDTDEIQALERLANQLQ